MNAMKQLCKSLLWKDCVFINVAFNLYIFFQLWSYIFNIRFPAKSFSCLAIDLYIMIYLELMFNVCMSSIIYSLYCQLNTHWVHHLNFCIWAMLNIDVGLHCTLHENTTKDCHGFVFGSEIYSWGLCHFRSTNFRDFDPFRATCSPEFTWAWVCRGCRFEENNSNQIVLNWRKFGTSRCSWGKVWNKKRMKKMENKSFLPMWQTFSRQVYCPGCKHSSDLSQGNKPWVVIHYFFVYWWKLSISFELYIVSWEPEGR